MKQTEQLNNQCMTRLRNDEFCDKISRLCFAIKYLQIIKHCFYFVKFDGYHEEKFCKKFLG